MTRDTRPRSEFAASLRAWFVEEMQLPEHADECDTNEPAAVDQPLIDLNQDDQARRTRRGWLLLAQAAAAVVVVAGLWWVTDRSSEPAIPVSEPALPTTIGTDPIDPSSVARRACEGFRAGASELALGASSDEVIDAATEVRTRLITAAARLDEQPAALAESRRLADEALDATDRLIAVADQDRPTVDSAVRNLDLLVTAWSRELSSVANDSTCDDLPTLREVL